MRIGILTFHRSFNYGAFMQCFSLVTRLKRTFPGSDIEVVDYTSMNALAGYDDEIKRAEPDIANKLKSRNSSFKQCQEILPLSNRRIISDDIEDITHFLNENYDVIVVGSDAVWNWISRGFPNVYFLKDYKGVKLSYAASAHGQIYQNMTDEQRSYLADSFSTFRYIGVRDTTTENLVHYVDPNISVNHNCDPTMFLDLNDVPCDMDALKEKMVAHGVDFSKPLIGLMAGDCLGYEIKKHYGDEIQLVSLYEPNKYADVYLYDLTPFEWAHVFSYFKVTITHFFHGTMLSLVNSTPVIPIELTNSFSVQNKTKINDLMTRIGLQEWRHEIDVFNESLFRKVLRKLRLTCNSDLWSDVFRQIDSFMMVDKSQLIKNAVNKERLHADSFFEALQEVINKQ